MIVEVGRRARYGVKSAVSHGWLQALSSSTITLKMPQAPEGLSSRNRLFASVFGLFENEGPRQGCHTLARQRTAPYGSGGSSKITHEVMPF